MRKRTVGSWMAATAVVVGSLSFSIPVGAEGGLTLEERVERLERRGELPAAASTDTSELQRRLDQIEAHIKNLPFGIKLGGGIATSYMYDFNNPDSHNVSLRAFDRDSNSIVLDLFQLEVSRAPGEDGVGFVTKVNFGKLAERSSSDWHGDGKPGMCSGSDPSCSIDLEEAYITYNFPGAPDFQIKAGKFVTLLGAEVIEPWRNPNVSRSLQYTFAIPIGHTGALASYAFSEMASATLGIVNGWDNVVDSNDGKSVTANFTITPVEQFSVAINGIYGCEQPDNGYSKRGVADLVATIKPVENLAIILNYDYGNESGLGVGGNEQWNAASGIVAYDIPDLLVVPIGFALRGEYFDDSDGTRLQGQLQPGDPGYGKYQNAWEVTGTFKVVLAEGLMFRTEYRYDSAHNNLYEDDSSGDDFRDSQQTIAAELSYVF
jgi:hypothetical protein